MEELILHPGGLTLTQELLQLSQLSQNAVVLDVGCGSGATVRFLRKKGFVAFGIDPRYETDVSSPFLLSGTADDIPFEDDSVDAVLCECTFSLFPDAEKALKEFSRVLRTDGQLLISDLYSKDEFFRCDDTFYKNFYTKEILYGILEKQDFFVTEFSDCSDNLGQMLGQMILNGYSYPFALKEVSHRIKIGYYMATALLYKKRGTK